MPTDPQTLNLIFLLTQACEDLARASLTAAQNQLQAKSITQADFDVAFSDYATAMQQARNMYYQASHNQAQQMASSIDIKKLTDETTSLKNSLAKLQKAELILTTSFEVIAVTAAIAAAVTSPNAATLGAVGVSIQALAETIGG